MGKAFNIDENKLAPVEKEKFKKGWNMYQFNEYASSLVSTHRSLPDMRPDAYVEKNCLW